MQNMKVLSAVSSAGPSRVVNFFHFQPKILFLYEELLEHTVWKTINDTILKLSAVR
jgi:hypothetical protein